MRYLDLKLEGTKLWVTVWVSEGDTKEEMHKVTQQWLKDTKLTAKVKPSTLANCITYDRPNGLLALLAVHGPQHERIALLTHEAMHLADDFWKGRKLPKEDKYDRAEQKCRLVEEIIRWYVRP